MNILTIILIIVFSSLLIYYLKFLNDIYNGLKKVKLNNKKQHEYNFVSVIVPFRNEEKNILNSLKSLSSQSLSKDKFEVIYIDDNSEDSSFKLLDEINKEKNFILLKSPYADNDRAHKKKAIAYAIDNSKGDIIISTDADCIHGEKWLETMLSFFDSNTAFLSGPVQFIGNANIFDNLQKIEFSSLILVGAGLIGNKTPIICNAANLGFRKKVYEEVGGYNDNLNLSSGDDEFLMQKISRTTNYRIRFCHDENAIVHTAPNESIGQFYQQRKRWASKGFHYVDRKIILKLVLIFLFYLSIPIQLLLGIFYSKILITTGVITLIIKFISEYIIMMGDSNSLFSKTKTQIFIIAELLHIPYIIISGISGIFGNYRWKGREIER